jgi:hypothetical protein
MPKAHPFTIKKRVIIKVLFILLGVLMFGGLVYASFRILSHFPTQPITEPPTPIPTNQLQLKPPEDWKVYRNEEYGFEIKYPNDWIVESYNSYIRFLQSKYLKAMQDYPFIYIKINPNPQKLSIREFYNRPEQRDWFSQSNNEYTQGSITGRPYYKFIPYITYAGEVVVVIELDSAFLEIGKIFGENGILDAMLSTLKFD